MTAAQANVAHEKSNMAGGGQEAHTMMVQLTVELFDLFRETIGRADLPSNILKGALRTVLKLFEYKRTLVQILLCSFEHPAKSFKPGPFLKAMFECQFDSHDMYQEEIILLTI